MREQFPPVSINFSSLNVTGWPGLALVLIVVAIAMEFPQTRWLLLSGIVAGALLATVLIVVRRRRA
jgi:L-asparagine transporter-like permease